VENRTVLVVDDDEKTLMSVKRGVIDEPYKTLFALSGKEALEILKREKVHVIITDMRMPDMSGLELLVIVKHEYPRIVRMVLSGYTQKTTLLTAINRGEIFRYITKPCKLEREFKPVVREAIRYYDLHNVREDLKEDLKPDSKSSYHDIKNPYVILNISRNATQEEIKRAYRRMAAEYHPDKTAHLGREIQELAYKKMKSINEAYELLK
jgi:CheY-like chemotaxis protein